MTIRRATNADLASIARLARALASAAAEDEIAARAAKALAHPDHRIWVFERDGTITGYVHAFIRTALEKPIEVVVQSIVTDESARKRGIGRALMAEVEGWAKATGHGSVALHTRNAQHFYGRLGYEPVADPTLMRKRL